MPKRKRKDVSSLFIRGAVWLCVIWVGVAVLVANWTMRHPAKSPALSTAKQAKLRYELHTLEKQAGTPDSIMQIQRKRAQLIIDYLNRGQVVAGRKELITYKNFIETNPDLKVLDKIELLSQLALIYMTLNEFEPALKQYDLIIKELSDAPDYEMRLLKARMLNDRGIANYLCAQTFDNPKLMKHYLENGQRDFNDCKTLVEALIAERPGREKGREDLVKLLQLNRAYFDDDMLFTPARSRP